MSQFFSLEGKRVLLTGSARGIGYLLTRGLAEAGADEIVNATTHEGAEKGAAQVPELGFRAHANAFDVTQSA
uniref:SDR family NAD(P)-dependent oxidoreductase n=1 Tax=Pantoea sp. GbtcB22 TaxID=2824767 RepID=UPI001C2F90FF